MTRYVSNFLSSTFAVLSLVLRTSNRNVSITNAKKSSGFSYKGRLFFPPFFESISNRSSYARFTFSLVSSSGLASFTSPIANGSPPSSPSIALVTHFGAVASGTLSHHGTYGLISKTGVPSTKSIPPSVTSPRSQSTLIILPKLNPTGRGRCGVRVDKHPRFSPFNLGTETKAFTAPPFFVPHAFVFA